MSEDDWDEEPPVSVLALAARMGVRPSMREFLSMPHAWREAWATEVDKVEATRAVLVGLASQGPTPAAFVLAGAGDEGPLVARLLAEAHARALEAEAKRPRGEASH